VCLYSLLCAPVLVLVCCASLYLSSLVGSCLMCLLGFALIVLRGFLINWLLPFAPVISRFGFGQNALVKYPAVLTKCLFGFRLCVYVFVLCKLNHPCKYLALTKHLLVKCDALLGVFRRFWAN